MNNKKPSKKSKKKRLTSKHSGPTKPQESNQSFSTEFHGSVYGPVSTGSGDIIVEKLDYGIGGNKVLGHIENALRNLEKPLYDSILSIVFKLSQRNQVNTSEVLDYIAQHPLSREEANNIVSAVKKVLQTTDKQLLENTIEQSTETIQDAIESPRLGVDHKVKLSIPIIPLFLQYEGEINLDNKMNLEKMWGWLQSKFQRKN